MTLRREFCEKYGHRLLPTVRRFVVLGVSWNGGMIASADTEAEGVFLHGRDRTWKGLAAVTSSHPSADELRAYIEWKATHSAAV